MGDEGGSCIEAAPTVALPGSVPESSGVAFGRRDPSVIWTHNDSGGEARIYAVTPGGDALGDVRVSGAENVDWEDMEIAACQEGSCLYLADVGDNAETRDQVVVYRVPEPAPTDEATAAATVLPMRYPDGPRDAEAIFVLPGEGLHVVSKGRSDPAALYRYPGPLRAGEVVTLEWVRDVTDGRPGPADQVTGASTSPDGTAVALRTYTALHLYAVQDDSLSERPLLSQSLRTLLEPQGEAVGLGEAGLVALTSEAARGSGASLSFIRCRTTP